jgi:LmbE family N-acetylglucosaminyl deacetylase
MKRFLLAAAVVGGVLAGLGVGPLAQMRVTPLDQEQGDVALGLLLRRLGNTGIFMQATAHPDDENNGLLVLLNRGLGYRTVLATATRGNGGQNEIGPELFEALGVLRTEELHAIHRFDGAEQYFTRAVDFGYSFSLEETFEKWGRDEIVGDFVRLIRMIRPDVILSMSPTGAGGGQHHQASAVLAREAFGLAGDATKYPDQMADGLRPWQPRKFYLPAGRGGPPTGAQPAAGGPVTINLGAYDRLLGRTYAEIGTEARSMHKCQGMAQLLSLPGPSSTSCQLAESSIPGQLQRTERSLFDNIDTTIPGLAAFAGSAAPRQLMSGLSAIAVAVENARKAFEATGAQAALDPLLAGLGAVRTLRGQLRGLAISDEARYEIEYRLRQKEREFQQAIVVAAGIRVEALADDGVVVPGQPVRLSVIVANRGTRGVTIGQVRLDGFEGTAECQLGLATGGGGRGGPGPGGRGGRGGAPAVVPAAGVSVLGADEVARCEPQLTIPATARVTAPYWHREGDAGRYTLDADAPFGLPYRPTPFYAQVTFSFGAGTADVIHGLPVQYRYEGDIFSGEKRTELLVVPAFSVRVTPEVAILPLSAARTSTPASREIRVTVVNGARGAADGVARVEMPQGWRIAPPEQALTFTREDESQTVRFQVTPSITVPAGEVRVRATVTSSGTTFDRGYQVIEYAHIRRQHVVEPAEARVKVLDVRTAPNLTVGYVMGVGDEVPAAIAQLGARVEFIDADTLAWGDLSRFPTIVTGVRAYERRGDLRANNTRLIEYVRAGGNLVVQYNKFEFNEAQYGPYPAQVSNDRVTDEFAPVTVLQATNPVFTTPNRITEATWAGWVQERGLYFLGERDSRYRDLVEMSDPFPYNSGPKRGALVQATLGKGRWTYVGLGLWRQLPAGVDGAYPLLANLINPVAAAPPAGSGR